MTSVAVESSKTTVNALSVENVSHAYGARIALNPFTYAVELIRFAFYGQVNWLALGVVAGCTAAFLSAAVIAYDPARGMLMRRGG